MITQVAVVGILAIGVTQVIIAGGIDLSGGSIIGATSMIAMSFAQSSVFPRADLHRAGLDRSAGYRADCRSVSPSALVCGLDQRCLIAYVKIPPFIATLGMMVSARGVALWYTQGQPISFPTDRFKAIGAGLMPVWIFIAVAVAVRADPALHALWQAHLRDRLERGGGADVRHQCRAASDAGLRHCRRCWLASPAWCLTARSQTAQALFGTTNELDAIAMAVIGGVSLSGGRGSIFGTAIGMLIFGVIISGFIFLSVDAYYQNMVKGAIIVGAVVLDQWRQTSAQAMEV